MFQPPKNDQRVTVIGRTGSGKTVFGAWLLSISDFMRIPRVIVDYKGDELLGSIERIEEIGLDEIPAHGGLYIVRPHLDESDAVEEWLRAIWQRERVGLYFDEAYMLPNSGYNHRQGALALIMTQGRSKKIPVISLIQRPSQINLFVLSEADYYAVFHLNRRADKKKVEDMADTLDDTSISALPQYHSLWYDVPRDRRFMMLPAPHPDEIAERIDEQLRPKRKFFKG